MVQQVNQPDDKPVVDDDATIVVGESDVGETRPLPEVAGYDVTKHIGEGGMADVWLGIDKTLKRQAAVKTMSAALITDPEFIQRFAEEAQIVARFRHDNIVTVFSSGRSAEHHWIAMEYISGGTLSDKLANGPLELEEALFITQAMAEALAYSHDHGIIHRDFKPGNILFTGEGTPILSDFGIAKSTDVTQGGGLTVPGLVIGSPRYMAPEQLLGKRLDAKVDVYALGLVWFEMLVGDVPSPNIAMIKGPQEINAIAGLLPKGCSKVMEILTECLREDPEDRLDAAEVGRRIKALHEPKAARSKVAMIATAVGFTILIGALVASQFSQLEYELDVTIQPPSATLFVDGQFVVDGHAMVEAGPHDLLVVEPQHYGQFLMVENEDDASVEIVLEKMRAPTFEEFTEYQRLSEASSDELGPGANSYEPFQRLLTLRRHQLREESVELTRLVNDLNALAGAGDPAAQTILFLANFDMVIEGDKFSGFIQQASNSGYSLATFFQALHYRWSKTEEDGSLKLASLQVYRSLTALAQDQGLSFADMYVKEADDLLNTQ